MNFKIESIGFVYQALSITVTPSNQQADSVSVKVETNELANNMFNGFTSSPVDPEKGFSGLSFYFSEQNVWDEENEEWSDEVDFLGRSALVPTAFVQQFLKELCEAFYAFHRKQDEQANLTIQAIRNLRVEDIVGEQGWEVTKTTSRRGRR